MASPAGTLIADQYEVETSRKLLPVGGLASFGVTDRLGGRADLMAIQLDRNLPPRPRAFQALAAPIERHRADDVAPSNDAELLMGAVAMIDPLAPLCWRGIAFWPDGIGPALAIAQVGAPDVLVRLEEVIVREEAASWASLRADRCDVVMQRAEARQHHSWLQQRGVHGSGGLSRLAYLLNPLMPCKSPLLVGHWVARLADLLPALEEVAGHAERQQTDPIDAHVAAFIAARLERRMDHELLTEIGGQRRVPGPDPGARTIAVAAAPATASSSHRVARGESEAGGDDVAEPRAAFRHRAAASAARSCRSPGSNASHA